MSHIFGPRNVTLLHPWYTDSTNGLVNSKNFLKLYGVLPFCPKMSFVIAGDRLLLSRIIFLI